MKTLKKTLCLVLAVVMAVGVLVLPANAATEFTDDADITHDEAVAVLSGLGIVNGVGDGSFNPDGTFTRAQAAALLANVVLTPDYAAILDSDKAVFSDVPVTNGYNKYITWAVENDYIHGYTDGTFKPNKELTGTELAALMLEVLGEELDAANYKNFVNTTAKKYKLTDGITGYVASSVISRDDAVQMMFNTMNKSTSTSKTWQVIDNKTKDVKYTADTEANALLVAANLNAVEASKASTEDKTSYIVVAVSTPVGSILQKTYKTIHLSDDNDDFNRPANSWYTENYASVLYSAAAEPVLEYTTPVTYSKIYADLGLTKTTTISVYADGRSVEANHVLKADENVKVENCNYGVLTQVYENGRDELGKMTYKATQIFPYYAKVTDVKDVKNAQTAVTKKTAYFTINDNLSWLGGKVDRESTDVVDFAKNDMVILNQTLDKDKWTVQDAYKLDTITGTLSKIVNRKDSVGTYINYYTIDGVEYVACNANSLGNLSGSVGKELTFRVDEYGYLVDVVNAAYSDPDYILVLAAQARTNDTWGIANPTAQVYGVLSNGTYGYYTVNYANAADSGFLTSAPELGEKNSYAPKIYQYSTNSKGELLLSEVGNFGGNVKKDTSITNGATSLTFATNSTAVLNNQTLFIYYTADPTTKLVKTFATRVGNAYCGKVDFGDSKGKSAGYVGLKYSDKPTDPTAAKVVFIDTDYSAVISTSGYAYIKDTYDNMTTEVGSDGATTSVYHYTAYKSDGTKEDVIKKGTELTTGAGLYKINTGNVIGDQLSENAAPVTGYTVKKGEVTEKFENTLEVKEGETKTYRGYTDGTYTFCGDNTGIKGNSYWGIVDSTGNFTAIWFYGD